MPEIIDIVHEVLPDQLSVELLAMENECIECCSKLEVTKSYINDQIAYKILDEDADLNILKVAEDKVKYLKTVSNGK